MDESKLIDGQMMSLEDVYIKFRPLIASLSHKLLKTAYKFGLDFDDLFGYGSEGLIKAFRKFDSEKGFKFMTYAFPLIKGEIQRRIRDFGSVVKFSRTEKSLAREIATKELQGLSIVEICENTGRKQHEVLSALAILNGPTVSINKRINDDDEKSLNVGDQIGTESDFSTVMVQDFLSRINPKLRKVVILAMNDKTQNEIAKEIGVSQVQVSRLLKKAGQLYEEYLTKGENKMPIITQDEYLKLKEEGWSDKKIAIEKNTTPQYIYNLKTKWFKNTDTVAEIQVEGNVTEVGKQPDTAVKMETLPELFPEKKASKLREYERLIAALRDDLTDINNQLDEKDELIRNLQATVDKYEHVNAACEDVESELSSSQEENSRLQLENSFYQDANKELQHELLKLQNENHNLELENNAMRQLLKLWM